MFALLKKFDINFNLIFDSKLDTQVGNPTMRKKSLAKLIELKESYDFAICGE